MYFESINPLDILTSKPTTNQVKNHLDFSDENRMLHTLGEKHI